MSNTFVAAMKAEVEAVVARYEALARAHQEALAAAREQETARLKGEISLLLSDRERARTQEAELRAQLKQAAAREGQIERELITCRDTAARAEAARVEAERKATAQAAEAERRVTAALAEAERKAEAARADAQKRIDAVSADAQRAIAEATAKGDAKLAALRAEGEAKLAEARRKAEAAERELDSTRHVADSLNEAFAAERALVEAAQGLDGTLLHEALRTALGVDWSASPAVYAQIKARRPDALLSLAIKDRGRQVLTTALGDREKTALRALAAAAGCELITPEHGARFSVSAMDKASTEQDPAEEGNVLDCLMPGLRLAGTEGAMVFPRVVVATG
jgi:hypothetical protein